MHRLMIIVPCYNEEEILEHSAKQLLELLNGLIDEKKISRDSGILFVNDGSSDGTYDIIKKLYESDRHFYGVSLAANAGHQNALLAGIDVAKDMCDISVSVDADLQDDISVIGEMVDLYENGSADIVFGVRNDRKSDSFFKRVTAQGFYRFMSLLGVDTVYNHADFRLMSRRAMKQLLLYKERNIFLRGIVKKLGYKTACVYYSRSKRLAGESKYPLKKMLSFAWDGITSFSIKPITFIMGLGIAVTVIALIAFAYVLISYFLGKAISGWPSIMISVWLLGGLQLFAIGIIGQYIGKTYTEVKERPRYNIEEILNHRDEEK